MTSENIKRIYVIAILLWCIGLAALPALGMAGIMTGTTMIIIAFASAVAILGSYVYLALTDRVKN